MKHIQHPGSGCFARHPRPKDLREMASSLECDPVRAICTDASGTEWWRAALRERLMQGRWAGAASREGVN